MTRERERAERCFALARSTKFAGERENAIARGIAIANAAGLDLSGFDIPGHNEPWSEEKRRRFAEELRSNELRPSRFSDDLFTRPRSPFYSGTWNWGDFEEVLREYERNKARAEAELNRQQSELDRVREERLRRADRDCAVKVKDALDFLWSRGVRVYPWAGATSPEGLFLSGSTFTAPDESTITYSREGVLELARARGWNR